MFLKISDLLDKEVSTGSIFLIILCIILFLIIALGFYILTKACFFIERKSQKPALNLIKSLIIASAPVVYGTAGLIGFEKYIPIKLVIIISIICFIFVSVWDFKTYGPINGIMFSIMHLIFGALASLAALSLVYLILFAVVFFFFGKGAIESPGGGTGHGGAPEFVKDRSTGILYHVTTGANGNLYIDDNGRSCLLMADSDYDGCYYDSDGHEYYT